MEIYSLINLTEKINKGVQKINKDEKSIMKVLSYISKIKKYKIYIFKEKCDINYDEFYIDNVKYLIKIEKAICEMNYWESVQGWILFDIYKDKVYYIDGFKNSKINIYSNYENLKAKKCDNIIELPHEISVNYSVLHKGYFYHFKYTTNNIIIKYDLDEKKILVDKIILPDANLDNQNCWRGNNNINLISDENNLYTIYAFNNNNKRISISLLDEKNLNVIKTWNTGSLEKNQCGPIFMIKGILYHNKSYKNENDSVIYSYDLEKEKSKIIDIPFENEGGYDSSLTYYTHLNCLMTVNNSNL